MLKSRDLAFASPDPERERGEEERGPEGDGEAEKEVKDEAGSGANSPHLGKAFYLKYFVLYICKTSTVFEEFGCKIRYIFQKSLFFAQLQLLSFDYAIITTKYN